jgi:prepilin-type N-terminal cleavage/methylation domain-containing protein
MNQVRSVLRDQRGFTLTELLVVTAVLGMILAGIVLVQQRGQEAYLFGSHRVEVQQNNRAALEMMIRELRSAQSVTAIPSATDLTFRDENGNTVRYQISGTTLNRAVTPAGTTTITTTPLIGGVQTLSMSYYSDWNGATNTGTATATPSAVKLIRLQLVTGTEDQVSSGSPSNQRSAMESLVRLRNIP